MSNLDFREKYGPAALVTGASSGIGQSFAEKLAATGMSLVLVARRVDRLNTLAAKLRLQHGVQVKVCQIDLAEASAARRIAQATASDDVGLLVSNAGVSLKGEHGASDPKAMSDMLMVNCHTPMQLAGEFIPRLRKRGKGGIILTGSVEGMIGCPFSAGYSASKAFVKSLGEGLWGELTPQGIDVLVVCPGATDTEALARSGVDRTTLQNVMSPEDVVNLALAHVADGPMLIASEHYRLLFDRLLAMPRREALTAMARSMQS